MYLRLMQCCAATRWAPRLIRSPNRCAPRPKSDFEGPSSMGENGAAMGTYVFETGKIAGGLLGALVLAMALTGASNRIFSHGTPAKAGYVAVTASNSLNKSASAPASTVAPSNAGGVAATDKPSATPVANESRSADAGAADPAAALSDAPAVVEKKSDTDDSVRKERRGRQGWSPAFRNRQSSEKLRRRPRPLELSPSRGGQLDRRRPRSVSRRPAWRRGRRS